MNEFERKAKEKLEADRAKVPQSEVKSATDLFEADLKAEAIQKQNQEIARTGKGL